MKRDLSLPEETPLKAVPYPRGAENKFERFMQEMTRAIAQQYENETFKKLNKKTVDKFEDAQVGNWARIFTTLSNKAKAKIKKRFNKDRVRDKVTQILRGLNKASQSTIFENVEKVMGINAQDLIAKEGLKPQTNALIEESIEWVNRNLDETLADFSANSLRLMAEGQPVEEVLGGFKTIAGKRVESSKFIARNQLANFNSFNNKIRYQNLGITEAIWVTAHDERVRPSHEDREGKTFKIDKGLYSSLDGKTLIPGVDYNCRCIMKAIIPDDDD